MGTIEQDLWECERGCRSDKVTERKKSVDRLFSLLEDHKTISILNKGTKSSTSKSSNNANVISWDDLFIAVHILLMKEAEKFRTDKGQSAASLTNRENVKLRCSALIDKLVTKSRGALKCSTVIDKIIVVLKDPYLQKCFGGTYLLILKSALNVRKYWGQLQYDLWTELLNHCFRLYEKPPSGVDKAMMSEILNRIVKCGCSQSHLSLHLRKKFKFLVEAFVDPTLEKYPALQASLLKLAINISNQLAKESRMATCKFGEDVVKGIVGLYEHRQEDSYNKKGLVFDFLLLQMHLHHPHGAREGEGAAYAYNWEKWREQLKYIYALIDTEIHNIHKNKNKVTDLKENFLQLAVEVCKQVFEETSSVLDVTNISSFNESMSYSMAKRRRIVAGIQAVIDILSQDTWAWLSVLNSLLSKYPCVLKVHEFLLLLRQLAELQSSCKDSSVMGYLCLCCMSLLEVEKTLDPRFLNEEENNVQWQKVSETTLRTIGLNQCVQFSHQLLQSLIMCHKFHQPSVVVQMYLNGTIHLSHHSLQTLQVILKSCDLPETVEAFHRISSDFSTLPKESLRCTLLNWLLPNKDDISFTELKLVPFEPQFMSKILVELTVKSLGDVIDCSTRSSEVLTINSIQNDYMVSSFEMGLLIPDDSSGSLRRKCENVDTKLVIPLVKDKLIQLLIRDCNILIEREFAPPETQMKLKIIKDYISECKLISSVLSWMLRWNIITSYALSTLSLTLVLRKLVDKFATSARTLLVTSRMETNLTLAHSILCEIREMFELELDEDILRFLQQLIPVELLDAVYRISTMKQVQSGDQQKSFNDSMDIVDGMMETSDSDTLNEASCSLLNMQLLTEQEKVQLEAIKLLCAYCCCFPGKELSSQSKEGLEKLFELILNPPVPDSSVCYFQMAVEVIQRCEKFPALGDEHVHLVLKVIQKLCYARYQDHEAATIILQLMCGMFRLLNDEISHRHSLILLKAFQKYINKKYGPQVIVHFVRCLGELPKVDPNFLWTKWDSGTVVEGHGAQDKTTPIAEELLIHIRSPFHEVRIAAARYISSLFSSMGARDISPTDKLRWQKRMFENLFNIIKSSFIVEGDLIREEKVDESANRTASALHCFAALIVVSPQWRKKALFAILRLVKEKNINTELVQKVLQVVGKTLKLPNVIKFMETNLTYLLVQFYEMKYTFQDFPWVLFNCTSDVEFYNKYKEIIVPVLLQKEDDDSLNLVSTKLGKPIVELVKACYPCIIACLVPCLTADESDLNLAKRLYPKLEKILTKEVINSLLTQQLDSVIVNIVRMLYDEQHFAELCGGVREAMSDPDPLCFQYLTVKKSLLYLQANSPRSDVPLVVYLSKEISGHIQKILLCLAVDIHEAPTLEDKLKALHRYTSFAYLLAKELSVDINGLGKMSTFVIRDISHTLIYLVNLSFQRGELPVAVAACHFYRKFCCTCFQACAPVIHTFLMVIVSVLVPLVKFDSDLGLESQLLLKFLIVENSEHLESAIELLDPFPGDEVFTEMSEVYMRIKRAKSVDSLEDSIKHFLNVGNKNLGCRAEGLKHLRTQLSEKKQELCGLYSELNDMRGFSEDCARSLLHQLICMLVELTSVPDCKISLEASRCLGELGPADLTTMVLKPEKSHELQNNNFSNSSLLMFTAHVVELLVGFLVDDNISVVEATSTALYKVLATREGQHVIASSKMDESYFYPFKRESIVKRDSNVVVSEDQFQATINETLWCPSTDCSHENWITTLVCSILKTFPANCFISQLIHVCQVKVSFAEHIMPYLVALVLNKGSDVCAAVLNRCICYFFKQHFEQQSQPNVERSTSTFPALKSVKDHVCFNRASVQCMLNTVQFLRLQKLLKSGEMSSSPASRSLDLNYLHVAQAAQYCSAYFTSIMYAELWCNDMKESSNIPCIRGQSLSELEYICEKATDLDGIALQNILKEAYRKIGDSDAIYGCGTTDMLDTRSRIHHYELTGNWQNALLSYDIELSSGNEDIAGGMMYALQRLGLHHLLKNFIDSKSSLEFESYQYECGWRLGQWNILTTENVRSCELGKSSLVGSQISTGEYEKHHYLCLKALQDSDLISVEKEATKARQCIVNSLIHASLESSKNLYPALSQLQALQEIEDFISCNGNMDVVLEKWKIQGQLNHNDFQYIEPILTQQGILLSIAIHMEKEENTRERLNKSLAEIQMSTAKLARNEGWLHVGDRCLRSLVQVDLPDSVKMQLKLEEAQLSWERGNHEVGRRILRMLLVELASSGEESRENKLIYSTALELYGNWMAETKSENPQVIVDRYFTKAQNILEVLNYDGNSQLEAYTSLARFVDAQYQQLMSLLKSSSFEIKRQYLLKSREEAKKLRQQKNRTNDEDRKIRLNERTCLIEEKEIENTVKDKDMYLKLALKNYLMSLKHGAEHSLQVFRLASLWLENTSHEEVAHVMDEHLDHIPTYRFLPVVPQLAPHISNRNDDIFTKQLNGLLVRCAVDHPHHTLPVILALANSHKDKEYTGGTKSGVTSEPRVLGAQIMVQRLKKQNKVSSILTQMEEVAAALIALAYYEAKQTKSIQIPKNILKHLNNKELVAVPTITVPVKRNCKYDDIVGVHKYTESFGLVGGINAPKKISCWGTDGTERPQLVKGKDDLRQDAVMQQVFTILNTLLKNNKETMKRKLLIRTYKIVPLSQRSGVLEWCQNTQPLSSYLTGSSGAHQRYYPEDRSVKQCRELVMKAAQESNEVKLNVYNDICKTFHPVFRYFFLENFPSPGVWFERRLAYIHSVATSSMIGYIVGLGDRHTINILIDMSTAEVIHIDFGIAFEQGHILPTPETVPFRLTRDIEDGMGVSGIEGVFRRCCEKTMSVLRQNQETIITILEVLLYDPLYAWTISPSKAYNIQQRPHGSELDNSDPEASEVEVNKMAERALVRLRQKLQGTEEGTATSISGQVNRLIQQARDPVNLCRLFHGWQPYL